ncbi:MAG: hypothetical protein CVU34_19710 [Betaproteobacteria bacterium HGW-Betaproteobacteria-7]|nr:MAG: hypothetical protein CVU34_19710 [Betaproteobacteria bacterium HGW-Betaproteobacteria-7]
MAVARYTLTGGFSRPGTHLPSRGHVVPVDFIGVGIAASEDPAVDAWLIACLRENGIGNVRLDFTYGDAEGAAGRLLDALLDAGFRVVLHLLQPLVAARQMPSRPAAGAWREFVVATLERYGARVAMVEICSTVNRKRWAGYTLKGFLQLWEIAWQETRARQLTLAGPSVTDFEPPWNVGYLALLQQRGQLPDIHTDNLFSERCTEPERYDHKILGHRLAGLHKFNLLKKAALLQRIGADFGVPRLFSPAAFWTLPRIERLLPYGEQKQADYLSRYMVLCAASGALEGAWWGPLVCHREGLVDDGVRPYPALERITHYAAVTGKLADFRARPALAALAAVARLLPGTRYEGRLNQGQGLEVHAFRSAEGLVHAAWTINGRAAALVDLYAADDLAAATYLDRDGAVMTEAPTLASEAPLWLCWDANRQVALAAGAALLKGVVIDRHVPGKTHHFIRENGWQGIVLAADRSEADCLLTAVHPEKLGTPPRESLLRKARNAIWTIADPRHEGNHLVVKQPVKMHLHKQFLDRFKPSKALRSWSGSSDLLRRGLGAAPPVAYWEKIGDRSLKQNYYLCEYVAAEFSARELLSAFAAGETAYAGIGESEAYRLLGDFLLRLHGRGIYFRDLSGGNILIRQDADGTPQFLLIDTGRIHSYDWPLSLDQRISDLVRICNKLHWAGREQLLGRYLAAVHRRLDWRLRLHFHIYDWKVTLKRKIGRKAIKRLFGR